MVCERCHQNPVTVHLQQIINGEKTELHLCQECASQFEMPISLEQFFQGFLGSFATPVREAKTAACPECGLSYNSFKNTGRLGCKTCYATFHKELSVLLKSIHGSNEHQGKFPKKTGAELQARRRLQDLRQLLNKAVEGEEFEEAARLRDEIRQMQAGGSE